MIKKFILQILLEGAACYPAKGASCLSAEYAWRQLVPDIAALARSACVAVEAWPPDVPKPKLFTETGKLAMHEPLGLQCTVRAPLSCSVPCIPAVMSRLPVCACERQSPSQQNGVDVNVLTQLSPQHANICKTLYQRMSNPVAVKAVRTAYIEAMCDEASSDLLCWAMEKALGPGGARAELFVYVRSSSKCFAADALRADGAAAVLSDER